MHKILVICLCLKFLYPGPAFDPSPSRGILYPRNITRQYYLVNPCPSHINLRPSHVNPSHSHINPYPSLITHRLESTHQYHILPQKVTFVHCDPTSPPELTYLPGGLTLPPGNAPLFVSHLFITLNRQFLVTYSNSLDYRCTGVASTL